jgi:hypothetical protein
MTPDLLIDCPFHTATHLFSAGNFQMRLAAYLLLSEVSQAARQKP